MNMMKKFLSLLLLSKVLLGSCLMSMSGSESESGGGSRSLSTSCSKSVISNNSSGFLSSKGSEFQQWLDASGVSGTSDLTMPDIEWSENPREVVMIITTTNIDKLTKEQKKALFGDAIFNEIESMDIGVNWAVEIMATGGFHCDLHESECNCDRGGWSLDRKLVVDGTFNGTHIDGGHIPQGCHYGGGPEFESDFIRLERSTFGASFELLAQILGDDQGSRPFDMTLPMLDLLVAAVRNNEIIAISRGIEIFGYAISPDQFDESVVHYFLGIKAIASNSNNDYLLRISLKDDYIDEYQWLSPQDVLGDDSGFGLINYRVTVEFPSKWFSNLIRRYR